MTDAVTLAREALERALECLNFLKDNSVHPCQFTDETIETVRAALAATSWRDIGDDDITELGRALEQAHDGEGENYLHSSFYTATSKGIGLACAAITHLRDAGFLPLPPEHQP